MTKLEETRWNKMNVNQREGWILAATHDRTLAYDFRDAEWSELPEELAIKLMENYQG